MQTRLTQIPEILATTGGYILWERGFPYRDDLKGDVITLREESGRIMQITENGHRNYLPEIARQTLEAWIRDGRIYRDGDEDTDHKMIFRASGRCAAPAVNDMHPLPETSEAIASGCRCKIAGRGADGRPLYAIERDCPIHA